MASSRCFVVLFFAAAASATACTTTIESASSPGGQGGNQGTLSAACALLAPCCDRWPADFRRSCSGPAEVKGPEGESACKAFLSNGTAKAYCPELDILNCSEEMRSVMGDACVGGATTGPAVGLETFTASNLGTITAPEDLADVTFGSESETELCDVDTATGNSSCLTGANKFITKRVGDYDVLFAKSITIGERGFVNLFGTRPVIVVATESIRVNGLLSVGYLSASLLDDDPRPGVKTSGPGIGTFSGGGAFCGKGGGGFDGTGGGTTYGNEELVPLVGGSRGSDMNSGRAGGAMQLVAGTKIRIDGLLNANGQDGYNGGGGSGGAVLLEAPLIEGSGEIAAEGGDGGKNVNTNTGAGAGGEGSVRDGKKATVAYASGGGGVGRIRLNARTHDFDGTLSPGESSRCASLGELAAP